MKILKSITRWLATKTGVEVTIRHKGHSSKALTIYAWYHPNKDDLVIDWDNQMTYIKKREVDKL